jgi:hypothetical protein
MGLSDKTMRGLLRYLPGTARQGAAVPRLVIKPDDATPVYEPLYIRPTEVPSGTLVDGCYWHDDDNHTLAWYNGTANVEALNTGTAAAALTANGATLTLGTTGPVTLTHSTNALTLATGDTLAVTDADKLTVNSVIVPTIMQIAARVGPHATVTEYDLFVAPRALQVTRIDVVPSTLQGGALTATIVKASGTAAPANGTTPMHTANSINLNTGAYTVQNVTLTVTTADLILAAGDRIGIDYSAALTAGHAAVTISYKYV